MRTENEIVLDEIIRLRSAVFGSDNALTDELAELMHIDEDEQRSNETEEQYTARQKRVADRKARLES